MLLSVHDQRTGTDRIVPRRNARHDPQQCLQRDDGLEGRKGLEEIHHVPALSFDRVLPQRLSLAAARQQLQTGALFVGTVTIRRQQLRQRVQQPPALDGTAQVEFGAEGLPDRHGVVLVNGNHLLFGNALVPLQQVEDKLDRVGGVFDQQSERIARGVLEERVVVGERQGEFEDALAVAFVVIVVAVIEQWKGVVNHLHGLLESLGRVEGQVGRGQSPPRWRFGSGSGRAGGWNRTDCGPCSESRN